MFAWDGELLWVAGPELGAAGIDDYDWEKLRGGGFAALDVTDGNTVVRGRFAHDLAWGNGGTAVVIAAGLVCGIGRAGEVDVYSTAGSDHPARTAAFAADSLGIAHAAVVGDRILYGFGAAIRKESLLGKVTRGELIQRFGKLQVRFMHCDVKTGV